MSHGDRLTGLDASFLHLETGGAHMHVASILVFEGEAPAYDDAVAAIESRLHLVPRYRQRLAFVPLGQGRPVWVDDPHFNIRYHVRHSALPAPGGDEELAALGGRLFAQQLDRSKPLWEMNIVEGLAPDADGTPRWAMISKTHHSLVDGVSGVDITSILFDTNPDPSPVAAPARAWEPAPPPTRHPAPGRRARGAGHGAGRDRARRPRRAARPAARGPPAGRPGRRPGRHGPRRPEPGAGLAVQRPHRAAPPLRVGRRRHRRRQGDQERLRRDPQRRRPDRRDARHRALDARATATPPRASSCAPMVPVSIRADAERGALGNRVAAIYAPLPVGVQDPRAAFDAIHEAMVHLKSSGQAVGAQAITQLADFAPPTILTQAGRLQTRQRFFNFVVTNVPGPQFELYALGRRLRAFYPVVPLARNTALGIAIMSYHGRLAFGLLGDYDAMEDLDGLRDHLDDALRDLVRAAGGRPRTGARSGAARRRARQASSRRAPAVPTRV